MTTVAPRFTASAWAAPAAFMAASRVRTFFTGNSSPAWMTAARRVIVMTLVATVLMLRPRRTADGLGSGSRADASPYADFDAVGPVPDTCTTVGGSTPLGSTVLPAFRQGPGTP